MWVMLQYGGSKCKEHRFSDKGGLACPGCTRAPITLLAGGQRIVYQPTEREDEYGKKYWTYVRGTE